MRSRVIISTFLVVVFLAITLGGLWFLGHRQESKQNTEEAKILAEVTARQKNLRQLVVDKLDNGEGLASFNLTDLGKPFTVTDVKIYPVGKNGQGPASIEEATNYSIALADALKPVNLSLNRPLRTLLNFYNASNTTAIVELKELTSAHLQALKNLQSLTVPSDAQVFHLRLLNGLREITNTLEIMSSADQEPIKAAQAAQQYPEFFNHLISSMAYGNKYLTDRGVKYNNLNTIKVELPQ